MNTTLKAPFAGKIANLQSKVYEKPNDPFCTLIDDRTFDVDFNLLESEVGFVAVGQTVKTASFNRPDHYYDGVVTQINPLVDDKGQINVRAKVNNTDGKLLEGMNVTVLVERSGGTVGRTEKRRGDPGQPGGAVSPGAGEQSDVDLCERGDVEQRFARGRPEPGQGRRTECWGCDHYFG